MTSREWSRRAAEPRARERLGALAERSPSPVTAASPPSTDLSAPVQPARAELAPAVIEPVTATDPRTAPDLGTSRPERNDADDLLARLRSGALSTAATAYTAANGHPLEHPDLLDAEPRRRWGLTVRSATIVALVLLAVAAVVVLRGWTSSSTAVVPLADSAPVSDPFGGTESRLIVHVVGEVGDPGVVELAPGARVAEAVAAAGGATDDAALGAVNLARVLEDGEQVVVPSLVAAVGTPGTADTADDGGSGLGAPDPRIDLNAADAAALESLPGIGPVLAERIIAWRTDHGRFSSVAELAEVSGIGPSLLGNLQDLVRV